MDPLDVTFDTSVRFRDCECPGTPHDGKDGRDDGDIAYLKPFLDWADGAAAAVAFDEALKTAVWGDDGFVQRIPRLYECTGPVYLRRGTIGWNLLDEHGAGVPFDPELVMALPYQQAYVIADRGDDLYRRQVTAPLAQRTSDSSNGTQTGSSTSRTRSTSSKRRPRSTPSS